MGACLLWSCLIRCEVGIECCEVTLGPQVCVHLRCKHAEKLVNLANVQNHTEALVSQPPCDSLKKKLKTQIRMSG